MVEGRKTIELAWAGWRLRAPRDWRPLGLGGAGREGFLVLGDAGSPIVRIRWLRPARRRFDARRWVLRCAKRLAGRGARVEETDASPAFDVSARVAAKDPRGDAAKPVWGWYGFSGAAGLGLELVASGRTDARQRRALEDIALPSLRAGAGTEPTRWAVFETSFVSPPGFALERAQLHVGDIALCLRAPGGRRLLLRQVYPADLALSRRPLEAWLDHPPFRQQRRFRRAGQTQPWQAASFGRSLDGILRRGRKSLPAPLGPLGRRRSLAAAVTDPDLERLLLAEYDAPKEADPNVVKEAIGLMNWALLEKDSRL